MAILLGITVLSQIWRLQIWHHFMLVERFYADLFRLTNRAILTGYFTVSGILAIVTAVIPVHNTIDARASTAMALLGRMFIVGCLPVVSVVSTELFPTVVRNIGFGWCSVMMRVGAMLAPQLGLLVSSNSRHFLAWEWRLLRIDGAAKLYTGRITVSNYWQNRPSQNRLLCPD